MIVGKGMPGDNTGIVSFRNDHLQRFGIDTDARRGQSFLAAQVKIIVGNEGFGQFFQGNIFSVQFVGEELCQPFAYVIIFTVSGLCPVYADVLFEIAFELVESLQQGFILFTHAEVGGFYPLSRNVGISVGDMQVVVEQLGLYTV